MKALAAAKLLGLVDATPLLGEKVVVADAPLLAVPRRLSEGGKISFLLAALMQIVMSRFFYYVIQYHFFFEQFIIWKYWTWIPTCFEIQRALQQIQPTVCLRPGSTVIRLI